jgi:hypothetical protein
MGIFDSQADDYVLYLDKGAQELRFKVTTSTGAARPGIPESGLVAGEWLHVAGVYDGSAGEARIYLGGALQDVHDVSGAVRSTPQRPAFGRNGTEDGVTPIPPEQLYLWGRLDDFGVWNRALLVDELRFLSGRVVFADGFESGNADEWSAVQPSA